MDGHAANMDLTSATDQDYIGESIAFSCTVKSGCQMSIISTSLRELPSCQTSCSNESSNTMNFPSIHCRVSFVTRIRGPGGTTRPRWARIRQLVGPVCGHTCTTGCITENFIYKQPSSLSKPINIQASVLIRDATVHLLTSSISPTLATETTVHKSLWSPCIADADIIFLPCGFFIFFPFFHLLSAVADWMSAILAHMVWP